MLYSVAREQRTNNERLAPPPTEEYGTCYLYIYDILTWLAFLLCYTNDVTIDDAGAWSQGGLERDGASRSSVPAHWLADGSRQSHLVQDDSLGRLHSSAVAKTLQQVTAH